MLRFPTRRLAAIMLSCAFLCIAGCNLKSGSDSGTSPVGKTPGMPQTFAWQPGFDSPPDFTPMTGSGAVVLTQKEAEAAARQMSPQAQGMRSWSELSFALEQSLAHAASKSASAKALSMQGLTLNYGQLAQTLRHMQSLLPRLDKDPGLLAKEFTWYRIGPDFLYTGYFEPTLKASRKKSDAYPYPLYRKPPDLKSGKPYYTRNQIDRQGVLNGKGLEIAWVSSEMDAFFLHIQGSGRLVFEDGSVTHVLYAGKNNRAYVPIGRVMRDQGMLEPDNVNMKSIRECLLGNPEKCQEIYDSNPSYVFFREASKGPIGGMGRPLTPYVSIAVDRSVVPHGALTFSILPLPDQVGAPRRSFYGITLPQDTGGAIKGRRADLFCGPGPEAPHLAGYLNYRGATYVLVKK